MSQYQQKKKRDMSHVPRPNLFTHESKLNDVNKKLQFMMNKISRLEEENGKLKEKISSIDTMLMELRYQLRHYQK